MRVSVKNCEEADKHRRRNYRKAELKRKNKPEHDDRQSDSDFD